MPITNLTRFNSFAENITNEMSQNTTTSFQNTTNEDLSWTMNMHFVITASLIILGLFGNTCTIIIMRKEPFRSSSYGIHLTALAVADMLSLFLSSLYKDSTIYFFGTDILADSTIICKIFFYFVYSTRIFASFNVSFISVERFIAVWFPFKARHLSSKRTTLIISGCLFAAANITGIYSALSAVIRNGICFPYGSAGTIPVSIAVYIILFAIAPAIILLSLTPLTISKLVRQQLLKGRATSNSENGIEHLRYMTAMLIGTVIAYIILVCLPPVIRLVLRQYGMSLIVMKQLGIHEIISIAEQINCSGNFVIYGLLCSEFRKQFIAICTCLCKIRKETSTTEQEIQ